MTILECVGFAGGVFVTLVGVLLLVIGISAWIKGPNKSTEGICSECGHEHSMEDRTEEDAVISPTLYGDCIEYIKYTCNYCKASTDIKWTKWTNFNRQFIEHGRRLSPDEVTVTFVRFGDKLIPHYEEKNGGQASSDR